MEQPEHCCRACPICGGSHLDSLLYLPKIPAFVNVLSDTLEEAKSLPQGTQSLVQCEHCGFVFNRTYEASKVMYDTGYHAERCHSDYYTQHIRHVVDLIESISPLKGQTVLEVACGDGEFLAEVAKRGPEIAVGVDPSAPECKGNLFHLEKTLFDEAYLKRMSGPVDIIINRHMVEHILNPLDMLKHFRRALSADGILYLETPRLDWILENQAFFDFPYEHCAYYSDSFMVRLLNMAGFEITAMEHSYDGQYFSICARKCAVPASFVPVAEEELLHVRQRFSKLTCTYKNTNQEKIIQCFCTETLRSSEPDLNSRSIHTLEGLYLWGAAAKGIMCANLLDKWPIAGFIDRNTYKQGKFVPGAGHRVLAPSQISYKFVKTVIVENDVYFSEIWNEVQKIDPRISVVLLSKLLGK